MLYTTFQGHPAFGSREKSLLVTANFARIICPG